MYDPTAKLPEEEIEACSFCGGDAWTWERPGGLGTPFTEVECPVCRGSGLAHKDDNERLRKKLEPDHDSAEDRLPDESRDP